MMEEVVELVVMVEVDKQMVKDGRVGVEVGHVLWIQNEKRKLSSRLKLIKQEVKGVMACDVLPVAMSLKMHPLMESYL